MHEFPARRVPPLNPMTEVIEQTKDLRDFLLGLRRRIKPIAWIIGGLTVISTLVAWLLPPVYESKATILIEEQEIPTDLVQSTITTYAWQRLQTINQRVMTRQNLLEIVDKFDLYADKRKRETSEEIVERLREDIKLEPISADIIDPRTGRPAPATIAFTVGFEYESPELSQKVASEFVSLYLNENLKNRTERATETFDFLNEETKKLTEDIRAQEQEIAAFKQKHANFLPEDRQTNIALMDRIDRELDLVHLEIRSYEQQRVMLQGQLAGQNPASPKFDSTGRLTLDSDSRLKQLETEYASALGKYSPEHPDVVRIKREMDGLRKQAGAASSANDQARHLAELRAELASANEKYSPEHPDIQRLQREIAAAEQSLNDAPEAVASTRKPDNPTYINLQSQINSLDVQLRSAEAKRDDLKRRLADYEARLAGIPAVEREYSQMALELQNAQQRYQLLKQKETTAGIGKVLEAERKGERFTLIDPPALPEEPVRPNRWAIMVLGLVLSLGGGFGYAAVAESMDTSVRGARGITATFGVAPLSVIPYIENSEDIARKTRNRRNLMRAAIAAVLAVVILMPIFWIPWDVLWYKGLRYLGLGGG